MSFNGRRTLTTMLIVSRLSALSFLACEHLTKTSSGGKNVLVPSFRFLAFSISIFCDCGGARIRIFSCINKAERVKTREAPQSSLTSMLLLFFFVLRGDGREICERKSRSCDTTSGTMRLRLSVEN